MKNLAYVIPLFFILSIIGCDLEQEIEIELPEYSSRNVVECYLQEGEPIELLITRSFSYFEPFTSTLEDFIRESLVNKAEVKVFYKNQTFTIPNQLGANPKTGQAYNYRLDTPLPQDYEETFRLQVITEEGDTITGATKLLPVVPIDSVVVQFDEEIDTLARVLTYFTEDLNETNFYRRMLHKSSLDSIPEQDFTASDQASEGRFVFGTSYDYVEGDTIINTVFHITKDYYDFWNSLQQAAGANGNPFGQPSPIISNVESNGEVMGIFTGFAFDRVTTIIEK